MNDKQELIKNNMNLVRFVIKNKMKYIPNQLDIQDLYQEGYVLLIKAAYKYDEGSGNKFSTYAVNSIYLGLRAFIDRYFEKRYNFQGYSLENEVYKGESDYEIRTWKDLLEDNDCGFYEVLLEDAIKKSKIKDIEGIINLKISGFTNKDIGEKFNLSSKTISNRLKSFEVEILNKAI